MQRPIASLLVMSGLVSVSVSGCASAAGAALPSPTPAPRAQVVMVVGDSFTVGSGPVPEWESYAAEAARTLDWQVIMAGGRGSGFTVQGRLGRTFAESFARELAWRPAPDLVVLSGGHNDWAADPSVVSRAATALVGRVRKVWPEAKIVLMGPIWLDAPPKAAFRVRDALARAAWLAGTPFVDPLSQRWVTDDRSKVLLPDGTHPTALGHVRLARWLVSALRLRGLAPDAARVYQGP